MLRLALPVQFRLRSLLLSSARVTSPPLQRLQLLARDSAAASPLPSSGGHSRAPPSCSPPPAAGTLGIIGPGVAGAVFGAGWWISFLHYLPGIFASLVALMFNCVNKDEIGYNYYSPYEDDSEWRFIVARH